MRFRFSKEDNFREFSLPVLSAIQHDSFAWLLSEGIQEVIDEINPINDYTGRGWSLVFSKPRVEESAISPSDALTKGLTFQAPWYLTACLTDTTNDKYKEEEVYMGELPLITQSGTFVINGVERCVVNQLVRSEGVFFLPEADPVTGIPLCTAKILPKNGAWLEFETARNGFLTVKIDRKRKLPVTTLLRIFGFNSDNEIREVFNQAEANSRVSYIETTLEKDASHSYDEAILEVYKRVRPGDPLIIENARQVVEALFFNTRRYSLGKTGRFKLNRRLKRSYLGDEGPLTLEKDDIIKVIGTMIELNSGVGNFDDIDHLGNRRVRSIGELVAQQIRYGFLQLERVVRERISLQPRDELCPPSVLISPRPVTARIHSFFASGQLSQFQEQVNPISGLDHLRRLSVVGPGGLTRERASFSVRDAHFSHYGRVCAVRTPEGPNIGLITYLALYARVNKYGFLETPYRKLEKVVVGGREKVRATEEVNYLAAYDEDDMIIADASTPLSKEGFFVDDRVPLRRAGEFFIGPVSSATYMDVVPRQIVGVSASLIPFLANDDVNRALVGANQQTQAVPLLKPSAPLVGTGLEADLARNSFLSTYAPHDGEIVFADASRVVIKNSQTRKEEIVNIKKFTMSNQETCYNQKVRVVTGDIVKKGDLIADGPSTDNGEMALGANLRIAYMFWEGFGYEDAIVISERLVREDTLSSIQISKHTVQVLETKLGPEEITRDIPNVSEESLRNLDESGIVYIGAHVKAGDILVGKIAPKGETELSAEERLLRAIFGEKSREVRDNSLRIPHGELGTVIGVETLDKKENDELPAGVIREINVFVAQVRKIVVGDKLAGRHGNKGVISRIVPIEDMPMLPDGTPMDIIISPASVVSRMNIGQLMETHLGWCAEKIGKKYAIPPFEKFTQKLLQDELSLAGLPVTGKTKLIDGRTGDYFDQDIVVGETYILKLMHMVEDKMHARSTGPYGLITQQPLGGKAQFGGQRFGEMEVWALEAYGAAHVLQEMLTIKSDDLVGRTRAYQAIIQDEEIPEATVPESFKLLVRELNGLALKVEAFEDSEKKGLKEAVTVERSEKGVSDAES